MPEAEWRRLKFFSSPNGPREFACTMGHFVADLRARLARTRHDARRR
jgi:hypothetical protein